MLLLYPMTRISYKNGGFMKRFILLVSFFIIMIGLMAQTPLMPELGDGSEGNPYQIASWQNLYWITAPGILNELTLIDRFSKCYIQTTDIDFSDATPPINKWDNGAGWNPIGRDNELAFSGTYDGNNKTISGLFIYRPSTDYQGLFGYTYSSKIKNIGLIYSSVTGNYSTGGLVGWNNSSITNCYNNGIVIGNYYSGGLIGENYYATISECNSIGSVTGNNAIGGLVGLNYGTITKCYSTGNLTGNDHTGGLVGFNIFGSTIINCFSNGNVSGDVNIAGLVGKNDGKIINCYSVANVIGEDSTGGLVGSNSGGTITNSFWDTETSGQTSSAGGIGKTTVEMQTQSTYSNAGWNFYFPWKIENNRYPELKTFEGLNINGFGSESAPYEIANLSQLVWLSDDLSVWNKHFKQTADITFPLEINTWDNGAGWTPIGFFNANDNNHFGFTGSYDGDNKTISGLFVNRPLGYCQGLFGYTNNAEIKNICLVNTSITGNTLTSGLVGLNSGTITNCYSIGNVTGKNYTGGLVGENEGFIINCYNNGNVTGDESSGNLVGKNNFGSITKCFSNGSVTGYSNTGGLVGSNSGSISNCYNNGNVTGIYSTGDLVGMNYYGIISYCYCTGNTTGYSDTGGLTGLNYGDINNCYSSGNVTGYGNSGGLVGSNNNIINKCYSIGNVTGYKNNGGLVGFDNNNNVTDSFWDIETSGQTSSQGGSGKKTSEMKNISTFTEAGWNFPDVWNINPDLNNGYPFLNSPDSVANNDIVIISPKDSKALLKNAYPNPFNPSTTLSFELSSPESVKIDIYNVKGQLVKSLVKGAYTAGKHSIVWDGKDNKRKSACSGIYFYKIQAGKQSQTKKMMLMK